MKMNRWTVAACTLTFGVGGLAVFATDKTPIKEPAPLPPVLTAKPPVSPANGSDTPSGPVKAPVLEPVKEKDKTFDFDLEVPNVKLPKTEKNDAPMPPVFGQPSTLTFDKVELNAPKIETKPAPVNRPALAPIELPALEIIPVKAEADPKKDPAPKKETAKIEEPKPMVVPKLELPAMPPAREVENDIKLPSLPKAPETVPPPPVISAPPPAIKEPVPVAPGISAPPLPETKKPEPKPEIKKPIVSDLDLLPTPKPDTKVEAPKPVKPMLEPELSPLPEKKPAVLTETKPTTEPDEYRPKGVLPTAKLKMTLRMGDGKPRFEIRNTASEEILLKVYGEKIEMSTPPEGKASTLAGVSAIGRVKFTAPGIEGTCDHLTILSGTGEVLMKGNIHLKTKRGKSWSEMTAEKLVYQIGNSGLGSASAPRNPVTPAAYLPDENDR